MIAQLVAALCLMSLCVAIHAGGVTWALRRLRQQRDPGPQFWPWTWRFIRVTGWLILLHLTEISVWAAFYIWKKAVPDVAASFYFSAVTYTTTGYGDVVLPQSWRLVGGVEALTGIIMCGWSTGFFFAVVSRMYEAQAPSVKR